MTKYTGEEFLWLGKLVAMMALYNFPVSVGARHTIVNIEGWKEENSEKFIHWFRLWIGASGLERKCYEPADGPVGLGKTIRRPKADA